MAQGKQPERIPQAQHGPKSTPSRHDKRARLDRPNAGRRRTARASIPLVGVLAELSLAMVRYVDVRNRFRLPIVLAGAMLAQGRRTAASWFRAAGVGDDWDRFYDFLRTLGQQVFSVALPVLSLIVQRFDPGPGGRWKIAIDDSPTRRFGRCVEAANVHHNPTPGPADGPWLYGHNWVCLAMLVGHPEFGVFALPLWSLLYVRQIDIPELHSKYAVNFRTKHELAEELSVRTMRVLRAFGSKAGFLIVFDGAYAASELMRPLIKEGAVVVTRLRRNAKLFDVPMERRGKHRGRPRIYGHHRISLAKRAGQSKAWQLIRYVSRGVKVEGRCKTFLARSPLVPGTIRVVLLEHSKGNWAAYLSTDPSMSPEAILEAVSDRWAIEEHFHDVKEVWGAGQQQVRNLWSNIGCWNLCGWLYTMVELANWDESPKQLVDRSDRPWDNPQRRPSHADKRRRIAREMLQNEFLADLPATTNMEEIHGRLMRLVNLAA